MRTLLYILGAIFLLASCEYEPAGSSFKELTPPDNVVPIEIILNDIVPTDTICIYQNTHITIKIDAGNRELRKINVQIDDDYLYFGSSPINIPINPDYLEEGIHKITVSVVLGSGTGSLAEMMGMEGYIGEMSWNFRVIHNYKNYFEAGYRINETGFLELFWDNPIIPEQDIEKYVVYSRNANKNIVIDNPMQKSLIVYDYVCGVGDYRIDTYLKSAESSHWQYVYFRTPEPELYYEDIGIDKFRVYWNKPFANGKFTLKEGNEVIISETTDTTVIVPHIFGKNRRFNFYYAPLKSEDEMSEYIWDGYFQGISLDLANSVDFAYNIKENILYTTRYNDLVAFDATTLEEKNNVYIKGEIWGLMYEGSVACAPHNSAIAAMTGEEARIYNDSRFVNPVIIPRIDDYAPRSVNLIALTSNDRLFIAYQDSTYCEVFNSNSGEKVFDFQYTYTPKVNTFICVTVSEDGRYFCSSSEEGMEVFEISGTTTNLLYADTRQYLAAMFLPSQPDKLLLKDGNNVELRQMPDFNLIHKFDLTGSFICNIDPVTGYVLYFQNDFLHVANINSLTDPIFKLRSDEIVGKLLNNILLTRRGTALDISSYINN